MTKQKILSSREIYMMALRHFGRNSQTVKAMEECGELIQALAKSLNGDERKENIIEEIADVQIMIHQMTLLYSEVEVARMVTEKTHRLFDRMREADVDCKNRNHSVLQK